MKVSLVIPCYNEVSNLQKGVLDKIGNFTSHDDRFQEVIIVDDGSTDNSKQKIKERYLGQFPKFRLVENNHQGKAFAVITGIKESKGKYVIFSDMDLATPIEESIKLIEAAGKGAEIVIGSRKMQREDAPLLRKLMAIGFILLRSILIGLRDIKDTNCGFKIFEKAQILEVIERLRVFKSRDFVLKPSVSAGFDLELLFIARKLGYKIKEVPVVWRHLETKRVSFLRDSAETIKDMLKIRWTHIIGKYDLKNNQG